LDAGTGKEGGEGGEVRRESLRSGTICNGVGGISVMMVVAGNAHTMGVGEDGEPCVWGCVGSGIHADSIT